MKDLVIEAPEMRNEIIESLKDLKKGVPQENTESTRYPHPLWDDLRYIIEDLLEDFEDDKFGMAKIEWSVYDVEEVQAIRKIARYLDQLLKEVGPKKPDKEYREWPYWPELLQAAEEAFELLNSNNHKYNFVYKDLY